MGIEGGPRGTIEAVDNAWMRAAEINSETLYPGLLEALDTLQPEGDRAVIREMTSVVGADTASDGEIARLWQLSKFDERAHDEMGQLVKAGRCTSDDIAAVFFKMTELGMF